jgi:CheY-like chemotaxis protein
MENTMNIDEVDVLMVEDSPNDAELIVRALSKLNIANKIYWVRDGEEAVDFIFHTEKYTARNENFPLKVMLLDLKSPKVNGLEVLVGH